MAVQALKAELLRLLREDEEFRLAVAGLLGLDTILGELKKLREDFNKLVELENRRWEENSKRWEENWRMWEENSKRWEENNKRWEENNRKWEEAYKRFEAIEAELKGLREDFNRGFDELRRRIDALGARWGIASESAFREGMRGVIERILGAGKVERWVYYDREGGVYGHPAMVEVDVAVKDSEHILIEVKSSVSRGDVAVFRRIGELYEKVNRVKPRLIMVSPYVDPRALEDARILGVEIYT